MNAERFQNIAELVSSLKPDLLFLTGDFLLGHTFNRRSEEDLQSLVNILSSLTKKTPTFAVTGNHDWWTDVKAVRQKLKARGIIELTNSVFTWTCGHEHLHICRVDDVWEGSVRLDKVLHQLNNKSAAILPAHEPGFADQSSAVVGSTCRYQVIRMGSGGASVYRSAQPAVSRTKISKWDL